jgi:mycothiol synthase
MITIRPFNPTPGEYETVVTIYNAATPNHKRTLEMFRYMDNTADPDYLFQREVIKRGGEIIAYGFYGQFKWAYHPDKYYWEIQVPLGHPDDAAIREVYHAHLLDTLVERNPIGLSTKSAEDHPHILAFLAKHGYKKILRYPYSQLNVETFDPAPFAGLAAKLQQANIDIVTLTNLQKTDPDWMRKHYELSWKIRKDVPSPDPVAEETFEQFSLVFANPDLMPDCWFVAVHEGRYVGESKLFRNPAHPERLDTGLTGVVREYRRKGIATTLKVRAIEVARQVGAKVIETDNEENNPMYQINLQLGFQPIPASIDFEKSLV